MGQCTTGITQYPWRIKSTCATGIAPPIYTSRAIPVAHADLMRQVYWLLPVAHWPIYAPLVLLLGIARAGAIPVAHILGHAPLVLLLEGNTNGAWMLMRQG
jgi:hypothetical protein